MVAIKTVTLFVFTTTNLVITNCFKLSLLFAILLPISSAILANVLTNISVVRLAGISRNINPIQNLESEVISLRFRRRRSFSPIRRRGAAGRRRRTFSRVRRRRGRSVVRPIRIGFRRA